MMHTTRTHHFTVLTALLLSLAMAGLSGCASKQDGAEGLPPAAPMSDEAQINYDYLVYQDQINRLQRHSALGKESDLTPAEVAEIRANAEAALDRLLSAAPTPQLYLEKAGLHWNNGKGAARARDILRQGLEVFPDDRILTIYLANSYVMDNRPTDGADIMYDFLTRHPDDYQVRERLAQMYLDAGKDAEALDQYKQIPPAERGPDALYGMARAQGNLGQRKSAIANLKKAVELDPGFTEAMVELAYQYELSKDYVAAEKTYATILEQGDPFPEARLRLINLNLKLNNPDRALEVALEGPPSKSFILDAAQMFIDDKFYAQGSTVLDMLTSGGEVPAEYYFYKAVIAYEGEEDMSKAMDYLGRVKEGDRLYPHALDFQARILHAMGKSEEALKLAREARTRFPTVPIFYQLESRLLRSMGDTDGAEKTLKTGIEKIGDAPELSYALGMLYEDSGRRDEAMTVMEGLIRSHPDHSNGLNYVGYTLAEENRDLDRALVLVNKAAELEPENGYILDSVAWVLFKRGELEEAWKQINFSVDLTVDDPTIWEHYGDIAKALGKVKEARKGYNYSLKYGTRDVKRVKQKLKSL